MLCVLQLMVAGRWGKSYYGRESDCDCVRVYTAVIVSTLIKKRNFPQIWGNSDGIGCKVIYEEGGFLIYEEMRKYFTIYEKGASPIWICTGFLWISLYVRKIFFLSFFYQCTTVNSQPFKKGICTLLCSLDGLLFKPRVIRNRSKDDAVLF